MNSTKPCANSCDPESGLVSTVCEICGAKSTFWAKIFAYAHFKCSSCGHLFVWPHPTQSDIDNIYRANDYYAFVESQATRLLREA